MADRAICEYDGKNILAKHLANYADGNAVAENRCIQVTKTTNLSQLEQEYPWITKRRLVVKPDQLIKRRGKNNLLLLDATWDAAKSWIDEHKGAQVTIDGIEGTLTTFIVEPFVPHDVEVEYYFAIRSVRDGDEILFLRQGGVDVGDVERKADRITIGVFDKIDDRNLDETILKRVRLVPKHIVADFIRSMYKLYVNVGFSYLEINPVAYADGKMVPLDLAAKLDDTAEFECGNLWGELAFPPPFGHRDFEAERYIRRLDAQSGASLKLTLLNPAGRMWMMVAGGGASVIYTDTVADLGFGNEVANYGEYSGNPNEEETYEYAKTIIELMTAKEDPQGREKLLLIGGGIANFTDVAKTFGGICRAIQDFQSDLKRVRTRIYVRRGGPNYKEGLRNMRRLGDETGIPIDVYGPETHMTKIVALALAT
jgi:succinyl-CoA synthetase beta subunit